LPLTTKDFGTANPANLANPLQMDKNLVRAQPIPACAMNCGFRSVQELLEHSDIRTTMIYLQLARAMRGEIGSPLDDL